MNDAVRKEEELATPVPDPADVQAVIDQANGNEVAEDTNTESDVEEDLWADIAQDLESDDEDSQELEVNEVEAPAEIPVAPEPTPEPEPVTPTAEEINATVEPVEEIPAAAPVPEVATPQQETPPQLEAVPTIPPEPTLSPEELQAKQKEARATTVEALAQHYSLSDEDATTLITDPGAIMPKLRAEMFMDTFDAVMSGVTKAIPGIIQNLQQETSARTEAEDSFYTGNPLLNKAEHAATVNRLASAYLNAVPNATPELMIKEVGVQAMFLLGIDPTKQVQETNNPPPAAAPPPAYVPAGANSLNASSPVPEQTIWGQIAEDLLDED